MVLGHTSLDDDFAMHDLPRWQVTGRDDLTGAGDHLLCGGVRVVDRSGWGLSGEHKPCRQY